MVPNSKRQVNSTFCRTSTKDWVEVNYPFFIQASSKNNYLKNVRMIYVLKIPAYLYDHIFTIKYLTLNMLNDLSWLKQHWHWWIPAVMLNSLSSWMKMHSEVDSNKSQSSYNFLSIFTSLKSLFISFHNIDGRHPFYHWVSWQCNMW